jgi:hypothetical protein
VRRLVAWIGGAAGGLAAYRLLRRRVEPEPWPEGEPDERADELRKKLDEARVGEEPAAEPSSEAASPDSPDERRRRVHEEGRSAIDEMQAGE